MKIIGTLSTLLFLVYQLTAQTTFISSSEGSTDWNNPNSWTLSNGEPTQSAPGPHDNVVVNDFITFEMEEDYTHYGDLKVSGNGLLQISPAQEQNTIFSFAGREMNIYGFLICTANFYQKHTAEGRRGMMVLHETATMTYTQNFSIHGGLVLESSACGATRVEGDLMLLNEEAFICGEGNVLIGGRMRAFQDSGNEFASTNSHDQFAQQSCEQIHFHLHADDCSAPRSLAGAGNVDIFMGLDSIHVRDQNGNIAIVWQMDNTWLTQNFILERSFDGKVFEPIEEVENSKEDLYTVLDQQPVQEKSYYRVKQILSTGHPIYSEIKIYDPRADMKTYIEVNIYPNRLRIGQTFHVESSRVEGSYSARITIKNLGGQTFSQKALDIAPNGKFYADMQANLAPGMYLLVFQVGNQVVTEKFQVQ